MTAMWQRIRHGSTPLTMTLKVIGVALVHVLGQTFHICRLAQVPHPLGWDQFVFGKPTASDGAPKR
jgi:hypothetical protein